MIRAVTEEDAPRLLDIYSHYVLNTAITFEYDVPSEEEFRARIRGTLGYYPYFAAERDGKVVGYAYAGRFHPRKAYDYAAEGTIYIDKSAHRQGIGRELYTALELALKMQNVVNLIACIASTENEDEYLTNNSVNFHTHIGYTEVGRFRECGYKFGKWYDMIYMEKLLTMRPKSPQRLLTFGEVEQEFWERWELNRC